MYPATSYLRQKVPYDKLFLTIDMYGGGRLYSCETNCISLPSHAKCTVMNFYQNAHRVFNTRVMSTRLPRNLINQDVMNLCYRSYASICATTDLILNAYLNSDTTVTIKLWTEKPGIIITRFKGIPLVTVKIRGDNINERDIVHRNAFGGSSSSSSTSTSSTDIVLSHNLYRIGEKYKGYFDAFTATVVKKIIK